MPTFYEGDEYYHLALSGFLKDMGPRYDFHWAKFSTFRDNFSDKDFLFHLLIVPFLNLSGNLALDGKYAVIFFNILFILAYVLILRKYAPPFLSACVLLLLFANFGFMLYFTRLRPATLANILAISTVYFLIEKKWIKVFFVSLLYALTHISFLAVIVFALGCETIRYIYDRKFFARNVYGALIGVILGCILHPNNPNNWFSIHLNAVLVPFYTSIKNFPGFGSEFYSTATRFTVISNLSLFLSVYFILWTAFISKVKLSFSTFVWWVFSSLFMAVSFLSFRYWYVTNALFFIFFASYLNDWMSGAPQETVLSRGRSFIIFFCITACASFLPNLKAQGDVMSSKMVKSYHYGNAARWMNMNIPPGETIYHADWGDSSYFIFLNPKNDYLVALDPVYMFYKYPKLYKLYIDLGAGKIEDPHKFIKNVFKANYGYTSKNKGLYAQIEWQPEYFRVVYEDEFGVVFRVL